MNFVQIQIPYSAILNDEVLKTTAISAILGGTDIDNTTNGVTTLTGMKNDVLTYSMLPYLPNPNHPTLAVEHQVTIKKIVEVGGDIFNYQSYIKIEPTNLIPLGLDEGGNSIEVIRDSYTNQVQVTWQEWLATQTNLITIGNDVWISGYAHYTGFKESQRVSSHLTGKELLFLINEGYTVLNKSDFLTLLNNS